MNHQNSSGGLLGLGWRIPLYRRYWDYVKTCQNFIQLIQSERTGKPFSEIRIRGGIRLNFPNHTQARDFFQEIWYHRIYTRYYPENRHPETVVDIGANIGFFTLHAKWLWPQSKILAFEPAPENFHYLVRNIQDSKKAGITAHNLAVTNSLEERIVFFIKGHSGGHSIYNDISSHEINIEEKIEINAVGLEKIVQMADGKIDFLKVDCEGCEWEILKCDPNLLKQVDYIAMEYHIPPGQSLDALVTVLQDTGFLVRVEPPFDWGAWKLGFLYANRPG
jgi:FkbM family methyltransferase